jgi:hypothetical protein|tara:strand:+ start:463 stop:594 length:132 start_codon:yes stop_codon:yes gene_type:complete
MRARSHNGIIGAGVGSVGSIGTAAKTNQSIEGPSTEEIIAFRI